LQSLCAVDKGCNVTGSTDIFLTDELSFLSLPLSPTYLSPIIHRKRCILAVSTI
jgi:hypothetical protein